MFRHRSFWVILVITAIVWLVMTMSEHNDYPLELRVEWRGVDTAQCVITQRDTVLPLTINSNCFLAISRFYYAKQHPYVITISGDTTIKVNNALFDDITKQLNFQGTHGFKSNVDAISIKLTTKQSRAFVPQLRNVEFGFAEQCGLSGSPVIEPDTVWLYGDARILKQITEVTTAPASFSQLNDSCYRTLALEPIWQKYPGVSASTDSLRIFIPIDRYAEKTLSVQVHFRCEDNSMQVRLYPERVDVTLWVPVNDYDNITSEDVHVAADYNPGDNSQELPLRATLFPSNTRIKQISPSSIQYVIIR